MRRRLRRASALLALVVLGSGPIGASAIDEPPSEAVYPPQDIPLLFDHALHVETFGFQCVQCHSAIETSDQASDRNIPSHVQCSACHTEVEPEEQACDKCHLDVQSRPAATFPTPNLRFTHQRHIEQGIECETCHRGIRETAIATVDHLPRMDDCLACHDGRRAPDRCSTCHLQEGGTLVKVFESGWLRPRSHTEGWHERHQIEAEADVETCTACHSMNECLDCHDGSVKPDFHPSDWVLLHPREAMTQELVCSSCHASEVFCRDCHDRLEVTLSTLSPDRAFHPPGWQFVDPNRPDQHHSNFARRNMNTCVSCHLENDCLQCHSGLGGAGFSPHPPGFDGRRLRDLDPTVCLRCHVPDDPRIR